MKKGILRGAIFLILLLLALYGTNSVLRLKYHYGIHGLTKFYEQEENSIDVLIFGSSHAFTHFNTTTLWEEHGMAAYVLGGGYQPLWNTYYYIQEALKTQTPKLIVLEAFGGSIDWEYSEDSKIIENTYGLKWSKNKIDSIKVSSPKERWQEFFLEHTQYHTRYTDLSREDFLPDKGDVLFATFKGSVCNMHTDPLSTFYPKQDGSVEELFPKTEEYYRKILDLAAEKNIPIAVVMSPYPIYDLVGCSNRMAEIAAEYNVDYIDCNFNIDEMGIDYSTDASDAGHLNYRGNQKFTHYIGQYLKDRFSIPDRRNDENYASWDTHAQYLRQAIKNQEFRDAQSLSEISSRLTDENYSILFSVDGSCTSDDPILKKIFANLDIPTDQKQGVWYYTNKGLEWYSLEDTTEYYISTKNHDFALKRFLIEPEVYVNVLEADGTEHKKVAHGVNVIVYDTLSDEIVDIFGVNQKDDYALVR